MRCFRFVDFSKIKKPTILTIGNFDGIHIGHKKIINHMKNIADAMNLSSSILLFEPQPKEFFYKHNYSFRITPLRDKIQEIKRIKEIDHILCIRFNKYIKNMDPDFFIKEILVKKLEVKHIIIGEDFRFGFKRIGNFELLKKMGKNCGFSVEKLPFILKNGIRISSSYIRSLIKAHNFKQAECFLGHPYRLSGIVRHGKKIGRTIGFPTINILIYNKVIISGVFIVKVHIKAQIYEGIANISIRNTWYLLETNILNFYDNIYGEYVTIEFLSFIRETKTFFTLKELKLQLEMDKEFTLNWFKEIHKDIR